MTKKDNKNLAYKLGTEILDSITRDENHEFDAKGWRIFTTSHDKNGNERPIIIGNGENFIILK